MQRILSLIAALAFPPALAAQDMVALDWIGQVYSLDSRTATLSPIGPGLFGQAASATDASGVIWSTHRSGNSPNLNFDLTTVEPSTGTGTVMYSGVPDIRALASAGSTDLWCIVNGDPDILYHCDTVTGTLTRIGSTGVRGIEGLERHFGTLYAWSITSGLMTIDTTTGRATDVNPAIGGSGAGEIRFLVWRSDAKLIGGKSDLYEIDPYTGAYQMIGSMGTSVDIRGAEEWFGAASSFGGGCAGTYGVVSQTLTGNFVPGGRFVTTSNNHASNALGALVIGFSREFYQGRSLPIDLDPMFGTFGCSLLVSIDLSVLGFAQPPAPAVLSFQIALPPITAGMDLHFQHAAFEPRVPGGMSWSDGATMNVGY